MADEPWTVERILRTPKTEVMAAIKRGEGPSPDVLAELVTRRLGVRLDRLRKGN